VGDGDAHPSNAPEAEAETKTDATGAEAEGNMTEEFEQPGAGGWMLLGDHFPGALTAEYQRIYSETCPSGMGAYMERYGVLARGLEVAFVHGHLYITPVPLAGPREMRRPPPRFAVWVMARLHPAFRRRTRAAKRALAARPWREASARWFGGERAEWARRNQALEDIDPSTLDLEELRTHLRACRVNVVEGYRRHFDLHGDDLLPLGLLLARCAEWGIDAATASRALAGSTPDDLVVTEPAPWQLVTGYDLDCLAWSELDGVKPRMTGTRSLPFDLRPLVPDEHHDELGRLVDDARLAVPLRDDNGVFTGAWPMGLLRRAMLEAGRRVTFYDPAHVIELTVDELDERLGGNAEPSAEQAASRARTRAANSIRVAPPRLGPEFVIPPLSALPRPLALIGAAQLAAADTMGGRDAGPIGIGSTCYTGRALVVDDPNDAFDLIEPGDVIITRATSPTWNVVLGYAGALVTTTGGLLSHAAVLARELGIPALIGDGDARQRITTGTLVTVDPKAGTVLLATTSAG
jgi:pyruvate,water dikinase